MRHSTPILVASSFALTACFGPASQVDSKADIAVAGVAQRGNGSVHGGAQVVMIRHPDLLQDIAGLFLTVDTLGLACIAGAVDPCRPDYRATADASGNFSFTLKGSDTQGSTGEALLFSAVLAGPPVQQPLTGPAGVETSFYIQKSKLTLPPLRLWESTGGETLGAMSAQFTWSGTDGTLGAPSDDYRVLIRSSASTPIWVTSPSPSTQAMVDARVTQDATALNWTVAARRKTTVDSTDFAFTYYSPSQAYAGRSMVPLSRGKDCYIQGASGPVRQSPCGLTDGNFATQLQPAPAGQCQGQNCTPPQTNNWVYVDLGQSTTLTALVIYDLALVGGGSLVIEGSSDLATWSPLGQAPAAYQVVTLAGSARYVRLRGSDSHTQFRSGGNSEIAIY